MPEIQALQKNAGDDFAEQFCLQQDEQPSPQACQTGEDEIPAHQKQLSEQVFIDVHTPDTCLSCIQLSRGIMPVRQMFLWKKQKSFFFIPEPIRRLCS